jgi:hypothetical protein
MNATYRALHEASARINRSMDGGGILASPYKTADAENVYQMMVELVPVGTPVRVTYIPSPDKPTNIVTREGVVSSHVHISFEEPDFHIYFANTNSTILLPGSVLEAI